MGSAIQRLRASRPQCQPHPLLMDRRTQDAVVENARRLISGDTSILETPVQMRPLFGRHIIGEARKGMREPRTGT